MPGPPKTPTRLKMLRGNPGKRKLQKDEPQPEPEIPRPPKHLSARARKEWRAIAPELYKLGILSRIDAAALSAYCQSYARWAEAEEKIAEMGILVKAPSGYPIQNPFIAVANKALELMKEFLLQFGMTPSSRARIHVEKKEEATGFEKFLAGRK